MRNRNHEADSARNVLVRHTSLNHRKHNDCKLKDRILLGNSSGPLFDHGFLTQDYRRLDPCYWWLREFCVGFCTDVRQCEYGLRQTQRWPSFLRGSKLFNHLAILGSHDWLQYWNTFYIFDWYYSERHYINFCGRKFSDKLPFDNWDSLV